MTASKLKTLAIFAKYWTPGQVKTRLAKTIGQQAASQIHQVFFRHLVAQFDGVFGNTIVGYWPPESQKHFVRDTEKWNLQHPVDFQVQADGDLGNKMSEHFRRQFENGASSTILIGSDCPTISQTTIRQAFEALENSEIVVGPSEDGGYYLIGMNQWRPEIFDDVAWSTAQVFSQTVSKLHDLRISYQQLGPMNDIDEIDDLQQMIVQLRASRSAADRSLLGEIESVLPEEYHEI